MGLIQGHGALLAFNGNGAMVAHSHTAASIVGVIPAFGEGTAGSLDEPARLAIHHALSDTTLRQDGAECRGVGQRALELSLHWSNGLLLVEWEALIGDAPSSSHYAKLVRQGIADLHAGASAPLPQLLQLATDAVRELTGFDRVMAYQFLPDHSGTVIAESKQSHLEPYLHLRYPAGDIPAQARRLYLLNQIRHIADVSAPPVIIEYSGAPNSEYDVDLSYAILRSVAPVHIEYLKNMGVAASMSVSIIVDGLLWGLIACHHMAPLLVPQAARLSCTVLAQMLAMTVERNELFQRSLAEDRIETLRIEIADALTSADDATAALLGVSDAIRSLVAADGLSIVVGQRVGSFPPELDRMAAIQVAEFLSQAQLPSLITDTLSKDAPTLHALLGDKSTFPGLLAIQINVDPTITLIWWRQELVETVAWAGQPEKHLTDTTEGMQLSPRKSFALWQETVRGKSQPWDATDRFAARELKAILQGVALNNLRAAQHEHAALLAIMGHDLRDPLQAIDLVVTLMGHGLVSSGDGVKRIEYSSRRMQSLIAYILDISRLRAGIGLGLNAKPMALGELLRVTLDQAQLNFPGVQMTSTIDDIGSSHIDGDRIVQALTNLLSNARHHGDMRHAIIVTATRSEGTSRIQIKNRIHAGKMFNPGAMTKPYHASSTANALNKDGLGLGLYIANAIVVGHGGTLECECNEEHAVFTVVLNAPVSMPLVVSN